MRIAQVIDSLRISGGAEQLQLLFAHGVAGRDVELTVITLRRSDPAVVEALEALGVCVKSFPSRAFASPRRALALVRFMRREAFDVVHTHLVRSTVLGVLAARAAGCPTVVTLHNTRRNHRLPSALRVAEEWVLRRAADRVVAVGWETARVQRERLRGRAIDVIPNAVEEGCRVSASERAEIRRELGAGPDDLLVLSVGRLHPQKAFPDLLQAIRDLRAAGHPIELRIVGVGPRQREIEQEIERCGLEGCVRMLGLRRDVPRLLAASDVYASSAAWEGMPIATLEAMAAGLPIVSTAVGDVPRIVGEESGILVPPGRPDALAEAIAALSRDASRRAALGEAARRRAVRDHGVDAWSRRLLSLYDDLRKGRAAPGEVGMPEDRSCA